MKHCFFLMNKSRTQLLATWQYRSYHILNYSRPIISQSPGPILERGQETKKHHDISGIGIELNLPDALNLESYILIRREPTSFEPVPFLILAAVHKKRKDINCQ